MKRFVAIPERSGAGGSFLPSKLIPALATGTPVLAVCDADSPLGTEMTAHRPGPRFTWPEAENLPALLASVDRNEYAAWQANAAKRAAFYDRERVLDRYAEEAPSPVRALKPAGNNIAQDTRRNDIPQSAYSFCYE